MTLMPSVCRYTDPKTVALMMLTVQTMGSVKKNRTGLDSIVVANVDRLGTLLDSSHERSSKPVAFRTRARRWFSITLGRLSRVKQKHTQMTARTIDPR